MTRAHRMPLADLRAIARDELRTNPTIEVYDFDAGEEWRRRPANPWISMNDSFTRLGRSFARAGVAFEALQAEIAAMAAQTATPTHLWRA